MIFIFGESEHNIFYLNNMMHFWVKYEIQSINKLTNKQTNKYVG